MRLDTSECIDRFRSASVAHLGTTGHDGWPHVVPVTFVVTNGFIVTAVDHKPKRTRLLRRLRNITENPLVSLVVDHYEDDWDKLWWIRADGRAEILVGDDAPGELLDSYSATLAKKYPQYRQTPPDGPYIQVAVEQWSGWNAA